MHWGCGWGYGPHAWFGGGMSMIFFWILAIIVVVYLLRHQSRMSGHGRYGEEMPIDILKKRYARGEITKEQYDRMREDLKY